MQPGIQGFYAPECRSITNIRPSVGGERRDEPIHIWLREWAGGLNEEVREEGRGIKWIIPVDRIGASGVEPDLHDDRPDIDTHVQQNNYVESQLCSPPLAKRLDVKDEAETKAPYSTILLSVWLCPLISKGIWHSGLIHTCKRKEILMMTALGHGRWSSQPNRLTKYHCNSCALVKI